MTEDEAKTKWCPFMKGDHGESESMAVCIASACMAWRSMLPVTKTERVDGDQVPAGWGPGTYWREVGQSGGSWVRMAPDPLPEGFCGLAGASQ